MHEAPTRTQFRVCKTSARAAYTSASNRLPHDWPTQASSYSSPPAGAAHQDEQKVGEAVALVDLVHHLLDAGFDYV